ncbi:MAG: VTT domain-containing protein [Candidatus Paceibacterota bacterium]
MKEILRIIFRPLFIFLSLVAIVGFLIQIFFPELYFSEQEDLRKWVQKFYPYDVLGFISLQIFQVIIAPISHYVVALLGGALYGAWWGGLYNWIGRMIGHISAYWIGRTIGEKIIRYFFKENDLKKYQSFVQGTKDTLPLRLLILFLMFFLPFFPDDELSYLAGLGKLNFKLYLLVLAFGHIGGSLGLSYIGAGIETRDWFFWLWTIITIVFAILLVYYVVKFRKQSANETSIK